MSAMCITVRSITVGEGRKPSVVMTAEGMKLKCFPDKIARFGIEIGATYNVETDEYTNDWGTTHTIVKAKRVTTGAPQQRDEYQSGAARPDGYTPRQPAPPAAGPDRGGFRSPQQITVAEIVCAYIAAGQCPPEKLGEIMTLARQAYNSNFGGPNGDGTAFIGRASQMNGNGHAPH